MNGFRELRQHHARHTSLSSDKFAELVRIVPDGLPEFPCYATCRRSVDVELDETHRERKVERLTVTIGRDPTSEEGGIENPETGTLLIRSREQDPDTRPYYFTGEVIASRTATWVLIFHRPLLRTAAPD